MSSTAPSFESLVLARLNKLEKRNRLLTWLSLLLVLLSLAIAAIIVLLVLPGGFGLKNLLTIEAGRFVVLDNAGRERVKLEATNDRATVSISDKQGNPRLFFTENHGDSFLILGVSESSSPTISLVTRKDKVQATFRDEDGKDRAELIVSKKELLLRFLDKQNKTVEIKH